MAHVLFTTRLYLIHTHTPSIIPISCVPIIYGSTNLPNPLHNDIAPMRRLLCHCHRQPVEQGGGMGVLQDRSHARVVRSGHGAAHYRFRVVFGDALQRGRRSSRRPWRRAGGDDDVSARAAVALRVGEEEDSHEPKLPDLRSPCASSTRRSLSSSRPATADLSQRG